MNLTDIIAKIEHGLAVLKEASEMTDYDEVKKAADADKSNSHSHIVYLKTQFACVHLGDAKRSGELAIKRINERMELEAQAANAEIHDIQRVG